jgi:pyruvate kinase
VATTEHTTYLATGTKLGDGGMVGELPAIEQRLLLHVGDELELTIDCAPVPVEQGRLRIGCTLPEAVECAEVGQPVHFDDGKISGQVVARQAVHLRVRITHAGRTGSRLAGGRGINLPETKLPVSALSAKDLADLPVVLELADVVELSFVREPANVERLFAELDRLDAGGPGVVLKIETRQAFERLPQLLLTAMRRPRVGVMIARGDLAVECGYERLAELQEEILWLCEAAHLPVIWATQVLEQLAKHGVPSRAEISDVAMSERAECVMLNKGPYIEDAVTALDNVLHRMFKHHYKKNALLRELHSWSPDR